MLIDRAINKGKKLLWYGINKCNIKGVLDIIKNSSEKVTLFQLMDTVRNMNHAVSIDGNWIFDSNYDKFLTLEKESLDFIYYYLSGDDMHNTFETVYYAVRQIKNKN